MARLNLLLIAALLTLTGCIANGGYGYKPWEYKTVRQEAREKPSALSEIYAGSGKESKERLPATTRDAALSNPYLERDPLDASYFESYQGQKRSPALQTVKVGLLLPLTGDHSSLGQAMLKAAQMALFDIGYESLELLPRDTKGTPEGAEKAVRAAVDDGAQIILGPVFAASVEAAKTVTQRAGVNMIAFSTDWKLSGGNTFIMGFLPFDQIERIIAYSTSHGMARVGVLAPGTDYGHAVLSAYRSMAGRMGLITTDIVSFSPESGNLSPVLRNFSQYDRRVELLNQKIRELKPYVASNPGDRQAAQTLAQLEKTDTVGDPPFDAVLLPVGSGIARAAANLLSHYDLPPNSVKRLGTGLWDDPGLASEPSLQNAWFAAPSPHSRETFENRFKHIYRVPPQRLSTLAYDATALTAILAKTGRE